jgi:1-acyl-sn-glycerol-3-phosphate acyltransferase
VSFGAPIASEGMNSAELMAKAENWIESEMRALSPSAYLNEKSL